MRTWLSAYLQACGDNANRAPAELDAFLAWAMDEQRLAAMRAGAPVKHAHATLTKDEGTEGEGTKGEGIDSS